MGNDIEASNVLSCCKCSVYAVRNIRIDAADVDFRSEFKLYSYRQYAITKEARIKKGGDNLAIQII